MSSLAIPEYRRLYKNAKGYHYSWDDAHTACPVGETKEVMVLYIEGDYYPLPERIELWQKWKDTEYD